MARGLVGHFPSSWKYAEENASVEVWLTIHGRRAWCGLRLSDRTMRHRSYKLEHLPASLRPTVAAAMVRLLHPRPKQIILDPLCGAGTLLAELLDAWRRTRVSRDRPDIFVLGGDIDSGALRAARGNLQRLGPCSLIRWDATRLPLPDHCVDGIFSNPPFGKQLGRAEEMRSFYAALIRELNRVLRTRGQAALLVSDFNALKEAASKLGWQLVRQFRTRILGQLATLSLWQTR